jgi:hypothetical protein
MQSGKIYENKGAEAWILGISCNEEKIDENKGAVAWTLGISCNQEKIDENKGAEAWTLRISCNQEKIDESTEQRPEPFGSAAIRKKIGENSLREQRSGPRDQLLSEKNKLQQASRDLDLRSAVIRDF